MKRIVLAAGLLFITFVVVLVLHAAIPVIEGVIGETNTAFVMTVGIALLAWLCAGLLE